MSPGQGLESTFNRHPGVTDIGVLKVNSGAFECLGNRVAFKTGKKNLLIMGTGHLGKRNRARERADLHRTG